MLPIIGLEDEEEREQQHTFSNINKQYLYLMSSSGNKDQSRSARHDPRHQVQRSKSKESIEQPTTEERPMTSPALSRGTTTSSLSISSGKIYRTTNRRGTSYDISSFVKRHYFLLIIYLIR